MKLTDFALIFIAIFLPVVIIVYVNTSFVVKAEKQEMYYKNIMNSAVVDAVSSMKQVENEDLEIDYGYSGIVDNKVSINSKIAIDTFYNSLANNFNIANNEISLERLKMYIPVIAILDYDGIYIHSAEEDESGEISFVTKPKVHYTDTYVIVEDKPGSYLVKFLDEVEELPSNLLSKYIYEINYTMDDYVYLNIFEIGSGKIGPSVYSKKFYLSDEENNYNLVYGNNILSSVKNIVRKDVIEQLKVRRQQVIAEIGMKEVSYSVNKHNDFAKSAGINYTFVFSVESDSTWYDTMDGIGMIAIIQGVSLGNRYLNYKAYSASDLIVAKRYCVSMAITSEDQDLSYLSRNLYHISDKCEVYLKYKNSMVDNVQTPYYSSKAEAATHGFYPCPVCKP